MASLGKGGFPSALDTGQGPSVVGTAEKRAGNLKITANKDGITVEQIEKPKVEVPSVPEERPLSEKTLREMARGRAALARLQGQTAAMKVAAVEAPPREPQTGDNPLLREGQIDPKLTKSVPGHIKAKADAAERAKVNEV